MTVEDFNWCTMDYESIYFDLGIYKRTVLIDRTNIKITGRPVGHAEMHNFKTGATAGIGWSKYTGPLKKHGRLKVNQFPP